MTSNTLFYKYYVTTDGEYEDDTFWLAEIYRSSGIMECTCMFFYIWKWSSAHALGDVSGVASFITADEQLQ